MNLKELIINIENLQNKIDKINLEINNCNFYLKQLKSYNINMLKQVQLEQGEPIESDTIIKESEWDEPSPYQEEKNEGNIKYNIELNKLVKKEIEKLPSKSIPEVKKLSIKDEEEFLKILRKRRGAIGINGGNKLLKYIMMDLRNIW